MPVIPYIVLEELITLTYVWSFIFPLLNYSLLAPDQFFRFQDGFGFYSPSAIYLPPLLNLQIK